MERIKNIESIQIDIDEVIKIEITRKYKKEFKTRLEKLLHTITFDLFRKYSRDIEVIFIELDDREKRDAMNEFLDWFNLRNKLKVNI